MNIEYTNEFEELLKQEAEKCESMSILHSKAYNKFNNLSTIINIPVIIISSIVGFLNPIPLFIDQNIILGAISLCVAVIKTLDSYFSWTQRSETHRLTSLNYSKISKFIQIQLSLERSNRISAKDLYNCITNDIQNIKDSEPLIPSDVITEFNKKYSNYNTSKPNIVNGLTEVKINNNETKINNNETKIDIK